MVVKTEKSELIALVPTLQFTGIIGCWYKMRAETEGGEDKTYYAVQDVSFSGSDA